MNTKLIAIVPAAGVGQRAAAPLPKQYQPIHGQPMLRHAVRALLADARVAQVRVIVADHDVLAGQAVSGLPRVVCRPHGGASRADTVAGGLRDALDQGAVTRDDWVLVHDAARPGLPSDALQALVDACLQQNCGGLLALPVADTVKRGQSAGAKGGVSQVLATLERDGLWLAQTPQMFRVGQLLEAFENARNQGRAITDESSAMELAGHQPLLVRGSPANLKVTWPEDFAMVAHWLPVHPANPASGKIS